MYLYMHFTHYTHTHTLSLSLSLSHTHTHRPCERATLAPLSRASTVHSLRYCTAESECGNTERQREKVCVCVCLCAGFSRVFGWVSHAHLARRTAATLAGSYRCSSLRCPGTMARSICEGGTGTAGNSRSADFASARRSHGLDREAPRRLCAHGATCTLAPAPMREVAPVTSGGGGI